MFKKLIHIILLPYLMVAPLGFASEPPSDVWIPETRDLASRLSLMDSVFRSQPSVFIPQPNVDYMFMLQPVAYVQHMLGKDAAFLGIPAERNILMTTGSRTVIEKVPPLLAYLYLGDTDDLHVLAKSVDVYWVYHGKENIQKPIGYFVVARVKVGDKTLPYFIKGNAGKGYGRDLERIASLYNTDEVLIHKNSLVGSHNHPVKATFFPDYVAVDQFANKHFSSDTLFLRDPSFLENASLIKVTKVPKTKTMRVKSLFSKAPPILTQPLWRRALLGYKIKAGLDGANENTYAIKIQLLKELNVGTEDIQKAELVNFLAENEGINAPERFQYVQKFLNFSLTDLMHLSLDDELLARVLFEMHKHNLLDPKSPETINLVNMLIKKMDDLVEKNPSLDKKTKESFLARKIFLFNITENEQELEKLKIQHKPLIEEAMRYNLSDVVEFVIHQDAQHFTQRQKNQFLIRAIELGDLRSVKILHKYGADISFARNKPLIVALSEQYFDIVVYLAQNIERFNINHVDALNLDALPAQFRSLVYSIPERIKEKRIVRLCMRSLLKSNQPNSENK